MVARSVEHPSKVLGPGATLLTWVRTLATASELGKNPKKAAPSGDSDLSAWFRNAAKEEKSIAIGQWQ